MLAWHVPGCLPTVKAGDLARWVGRLGGYPWAVLDPPLPAALRWRCRRRRAAGPMVFQVRGSSLTRERRFVLNICSNFFPLPFFRSQDAQTARDTRFARQPTPGFQLVEV